MRMQLQLRLAAIALAAALLAGGCSYTPTREDFSNPPDSLDASTDPPTLWYRDRTQQGYEYLYAYHPNGLEVCDGHAGCTMADGKTVVLAPAWYWRGKGVRRAHTRTHEECHVNAIQSGEPDRCDA